MLTVMAKTALMIDDDAVLRELYRAKFEKAGFTFLIAEDGKKGIEALVGGAKPDVILLDVMMPNMNGFEFMQEAKHKEIPLPPIIVFTSQEGDIDKMKAFAYGATYFVQKATATPWDVLQKAEAFLKQS